MLEYERFRNPPEGYRPMPFWFWNDRIEEDEITSQMTRMKEQQVEAFFIPRAAWAANTLSVRGRVRSG